MLTSAHDTYRHEAWFYRGIRGFIDAVVPFVRAGLAEGQPVMIAVAGERLRALNAALGDDAARVRMADMADLGRNPAQIIPAWLEFVAAGTDGGRPVRGVGEPIWAGRSAAELEECQLHEALLNTAVSPDVPLWLICPYDVGALKPWVIDEARRSHPELVESNCRQRSITYGAGHAEDLFRHPLAPPVGFSRSVAFTVDDAWLVKPWVVGVARRAGIDEYRAEQLGDAISQIAADAHHHAPHGVLRAWLDGPTLMIDVSDAGVVADPMVGRTMRPTEGPAGRRGTWVANRICELLQIRSTPDGTTVRVHAAIGRPGVAAS